MATQYISAKAAAEFAGLSQRRINQLVNQKLLPGMRIGNSNAVERGPELRKLRRENVKKNGTKK